MPQVQTKYRQTRFSPRVLIVEDDPQWQLILESTVRSVASRASFTCVTSVNAAREALNLEQNFDVILADFMLDGEETGLDLWRASGTSKSSDPFIMVTAKSELDLKKHYLRSKTLPKVVSKHAPIETFKTEMTRTLKSRLRKKPALRQIAISAALFLTATLMFGTLSTPLAPQMAKQKNTEQTAVPPQKNQIRTAAQILTPEIKKQLKTILVRANEINKLARNHETLVAGSSGGTN